MGMPREIDAAHEPWRYTCPNHHRLWEARRAYFWCPGCKHQWGVDPVFHELCDRKTGERLHRDEVVLRE